MPYRKGKFTLLVVFEVRSCATHRVCYVTVAVDEDTAAAPINSWFTARIGIEEARPGSRLSDGRSAATNPPTPSRIDCFLQ